MWAATVLLPFSLPVLLDSYQMQVLMISIILMHIMAYSSYIAL